MLDTLPEQLSGASNAGYFAFQDAAGHYHYCIMYWVQSYGVQTLIDWDLTAGEVYEAYIVIGRTSERAVMYVPAVDKLYIGTGENKGISVYDLATHTVTATLTRPSSRDVYRMAMPRDTLLAWGTYDGWGCSIQSLDASTNVITDWGQLDVTGRPQYCYTIAIDPAKTHIYGVIEDLADATQPQANWYLAVVEVATGNITIHQKNDGNTSAGIYIELSSNDVFYLRGGAGGSNWYKLSGGALISQVPVSPYYMRGALDSDYVLSTAGITVDTANAVVAEEEPTTLSWKFGAGDWQSATANGDNINTEILNMARAAALSSDRLLIKSLYYASLVTYDVNEDNETYIATPTTSIYGMIPMLNGKVFIHGYASRLYLWTPGESFTDAELDLLTGTTPGAKYYRYGTYDGNNVYIFAQHERQYTGGAIAKFSEDGVVLVDTGLHEDWYADSITTITDYVVATAAPPYCTMVLDKETLTVLHSFEAYSGQDNSTVVGVSDTDVIIVQGTTAVRVNAITQEMIWSTTLSLSAWQGYSYVYDHNFAVVAPYVYFVAGTHLCRIHIDTGVFEQVDNTVLNSRCWLFPNNGDVYLLDGTALRRFRGGGGARSARTIYIENNPEHYLSNAQIEHLTDIKSVPYLDKVLG